ncbi:MAG: ribokinase [Streptosporangiaceae bacterium]|nr:ribokinase [Streptosporangiaceae bacterium]
MPADPHDLVVVGSVNADLVIRVDRRPAPGETVIGSDLETYPGGKGGNQAVAAARLGARVAILGRVGEDEHGRFLTEALGRAGVDVSGLLPTPGPSGVALVTVGPEGDNSIIVSPGANRHVSPADVARAGPSLEAAKVVSLQLEIPTPAVSAAARAAHTAGARVVLNLSPPQPVPGELLRLCDPLVVNEHEAAFLLGSPHRTDGPDHRERADRRQRAKALVALGARSVVITLGPAGAVVAQGPDVIAVPSPPVEVVDTTGAGDAFTGALCWRLAVGDDLVSAARFAVRVGAAAVRRPGAQSSFPTRAELREL